MLPPFQYDKLFCWHGSGAIILDPARLLRLWRCAPIPRKDGEGPAPARLFWIRLDCLNSGAARRFLAKTAKARPLDCYPGQVRSTESLSKRSTALMAGALSKKSKLSLRLKKTIFTYPLKR